MKNIILLSFLGAIGYYLYANVKSIDNITTQVEGINIKGGLLNLELLINLKILNPTGYNIDLQALQAGVYVNQDVIGDIDYNTPVTIQSKGSKNIIVPVFLNPVFAAATLIQKLNAGNVDINIKGVITAEGIRQNYLETYKIV